MKKYIIIIFVMLFLFDVITAQNIVRGIVVDSNSEEPLQNVLVSINGLSINQKTTINGVFSLKNIPEGNHFIKVVLEGYETQKFLVELIGKDIDLGTIFLHETINEIQNLSIISITDDELNDDANTADNISGLLQASKGVFLRTAAFEFGSSFFKIKGLDSKHGEILINGVTMNKPYDGRVQWSNWGGLNAVLRNQEFSNGLAPSNFTFGGVLGSTNIDTRALEQRSGTSVSYASSNRSYLHRVMATHATGMSKKGWAFAFSGSRRVATEGFNEGTTYNAYSLFMSIDKKINDKQSVNFTSIFAPNRRGKSSPSTQEVYDLKGIAYNEYWGELNGKKINARIKEVAEPILMFSHYWAISDAIELQTNAAYQFGKVGNSRLDYNGGANPSPAYYQKLPSYFLQNNDFSGVFESQQNFLTDGQIKWDKIFEANITNDAVGLSNAYVLYEDKNEDHQLTFNSILNASINENISLNSKLEYKYFRSENFAEVIDLLGGSGYLDVDNFAETPAESQNNLLSPDRMVRVGEKFKYNYLLKSSFLKGFLQAQFKYHTVDFYSAVQFSKTMYQREGLYKNGGFPDNSLGESKPLNFMNYGVKSGLTYKITGRHLIDVNIGYRTNSPTLRNSFSNSRENNNSVRDLQNEKVFSSDFNYILRGSKITSKLTAYYTYVKDATDISFYFADGIGGDNTAFVQEILSQINKKHIGIEFGIEAQITPTIKLKGAAAVGQFTYDNNPNLYLNSEEDTESITAGFDQGTKDFGVSNLKNLRIAAGPQNAYSLGFEYRDPNYWWMGATANFFGNTYIDVAPLIRSSNFYTDADGLPFVDYDTGLAKELLRQEKFNNYMVVNLVGGKSWKINRYYISLFASVNNLLNKTYKSGGFEQGRNANYRQLRDDKALEVPIFGNKYWYGRGTTYFLNINLRL